MPLCEYRGNRHLTYFSKMAALCEMPRHLTLFFLSLSLVLSLTLRPILNVINISCSKAVSTLKPYSPKQSLETPSPLLARQSCQTSVYVIILIVLFTLNKRPRNFCKRASGQVTELSLTADRLGSALPPGSTLHPQQDRRAAGVLTSQTHTRTSIHICGLSAHRDTI